MKKHCAFLRRIALLISLPSLAVGCKAGVGILTLSDMINIIGMGTIFLSVLCSVIVMHVAKDEKHLGLARLFDRVSLAVFAAGYVLTNIVISQVSSL